MQQLYTNIKIIFNLPKLYENFLSNNYFVLYLKYEKTRPIVAKFQVSYSKKR